MKAGCLVSTIDEEKMKRFSIRAFLGWTLIWAIVVPCGIAVKVILGNSVAWGGALFIPFVVMSIILILGGLHFLPSRSKNRMELITGLVSAIALSLISIIAYHRVDPGEVVNASSAAGKPENHLHD